MAVRMILVWKFGQTQEIVRDGSRGRHNYAVPSFRRLSASSIFTLDAGNCLLEGDDEILLRSRNDVHACLNRGRNTDPTMERHSSALAPTREAECARSCFVIS